jgi:hypothetical protein
MAFSCCPLPSLAALPLFNTIMIDHDPVHHRQHRRLKPKFFEVAGRREYLRTENPAVAESPQIEVELESLISVTETNKPPRKTKKIYGYI